VTPASLQLSVELVVLPLDRELVVAGRRVLAPSPAAESDLSGVGSPTEVLLSEVSHRLGRVVRVGSGETLELHPASLERER
jgi:hypothetical protein